MIIFMAAFIILLCVSAPIIVALCGSSMVYALVGGTVPITTLIQTTFGGLTSFPLLAIPLFLLAGNLMSEGGLTPDLVNFARMLLGHIRGGLGHATILAQYTRILSPYTGVVTQRNFHDGDFIREAIRGDQVPILSVARTD